MMRDFQSRVASWAQRIRLWTNFFRRISYSHDLKLVLHAFAHRRPFALPNQVWAVAEPINGFLSIKEAGLLYWAACEWPVGGPVIELGSFEGRSTVIFALAGRQVHAIDAWSLNVADRSAFGAGERSPAEVFNRFQRNLRDAGVAEQVSAHRGFTAEVGRQWHAPGAILFVDAGHNYADVKRDLVIWAAHLHPAGLLLMHDVIGDEYLGVTRAASELLQDNWQVVSSAGSIVAFTRKDRM